jgi:anti-sigma regulatory factor (Ser/Thr protein kinase)
MSAMTHDLLLYDDDAELVGHIAPALAAGAEAGDAVTAVLSARKASAVRDALGDLAERVEFADPAAVYTRPEDTIAAYDADVRRRVADGVPHLRLVGELPGDPVGDQRSAWTTYDALLNRAFAHHPVAITCVYDTRIFSDAVLDGALRTHPDLVDGGDNQRYEEPAHVVGDLAPPVDDLPGLSPLSFDGTALGFRSALAQAMEDAGVAADRAQRMLVAASEVLTNASRHGAGAPALSGGSVNGSFACEIRDGGRGLHDPLAGYIPPGAGHSSGAGLWVARQLTQRLEVGAAPGGGARVRLWI